MEKTYTLYAVGMHCAACELVIERTLAKAQGIQNVRASLNSAAIDITVIGDETPEALAARCTDLLKDKGYTLSAIKPRKEKKYDEFLIAGPLALIIIGIFILLQRFGIVNLISTGEIGYPTILMIGIVASLSSCMAVVGGLVLSLSANYAKVTTQNRFRPQLLFHAGRIVGFFILGGVMGLVGSIFTLSPIMTFILSVLVGLVMLALGLNLLDIFEGAGKFQLRMPRVLSNVVYSAEKNTSIVAPALLGAATFFLPCGFTQSMQLYALSTQNILHGALIMFVFTLGTFPVLALVSFASVNFAQNIKSSGIFFKTAGIIVIAFAAMNIYNALVVMGWVKSFLPIR